MRLLFACTFSILALPFYGQSGIEWQKCLGGSADDQGFDVIAVPSGGYITAGNSASTDGDAVANYGGQDAWIARLDSGGNLVWEKNYGGSADDYARCIISAPGGGWVVLGSTYSSDGDVELNHGDRDLWLFRIDSLGNMLWEKTFGGDSAELGNRIILSGDSYVLIGSTKSSGGDVESNDGENDIWLLKTDLDGNLLWEKTFGGSEGDFGFSVQETATGYALAGYSESNDHDVPGDHHGTADFSDYLLVLTDADGNYLWAKSYGGTGEDYCRDMALSDDGGFVLCGSSFSDDDDISAHHGDTSESDIWLVKTDDLGNIVWSNSLGGSHSDDGNRIFRDAENNYLVIGDSESKDGDVSGHHGSIASTDFWLVKTGTDGTLLWQASFGGFQDDVSRGICQLPGLNQFIAAGFTKSTSGDVSGHHGPGVNDDFWIVRFDPCYPQILLQPISVVGCAGIDATFSIATEEGSYNYKWYHNDTIIAGFSGPVLTITEVGGEDIGTYFCEIQSGCGQESSDTVSLDLTEPGVPVISPGGTVEICLTGGQLLSGGPVDPGNSYQWLFNGEPLAGETDTSYYASDTGVYNLIINFAIGCNDTSEDVTLINDAPEAGITNLSSLNICSSGASALEALGGGPGFDSQWLFDGVPIPGETSAFYSATETGDYSVVLINPVGCTDTSAVLTVTDTYPNTVVTWSDSLEICNSGSVTLSAEGDSSITYYWIYDYDVVPDYDSSAYVATTAGNYLLVEQNDGGCNDTSDLITITDNSFKDSIYVSTGTDLCYVPVVQMHAFPASFGYTWLLNGVPIPGETGSDYYAMDTGHYTLIATSPATGCMATSNIVYVYNSCLQAIQTISDGGSISQYPNPGGGDFILQSGDGVWNGGIFSIRVFSMTGQLVYADDAAHMDGGICTVRIPPPALPGLYLVEIRSGNQWVTLMHAIAR